MKAILLAAFLVTTALLHGVDRLELANGDIITGTIVSLDETTVVMETQYGRLEIARAQVARGVFGLDAVTPSGDRISGGDGSVARGALGGLAEREPSEVPTSAVTDPVRELASLRDGLLLHMPFDGSFADAAGRYVPTNNGMRLVAGPSGQANNAARSDGTGTYISVAGDDTLDTLNQFTVSFWVRSDDSVPTQYLVSKWSSTTEERADCKFTLQGSRRGLTLFLVNADGQYQWISAPGVLLDGEWQHVAATFANGRAVLYVNGAQVAARRFNFDTLLADDSPLLVMTAEATNEDTYGFYNATGAIDDLRVYDRALSLQEVAALAGVAQADSP